MSGSSFKPESCPRVAIAGQNNQNRARLGVRIVFFFAIFSLPLFGQIDRGSIRGLVTDQSGAIVPDAKVQVVRIDTGSAIDLTTNGSGLYTAPNLPEASYRVIVEKPGFGKFVRGPIEVQPRTEATVDVILVPGAVAQTVEVSADAPVLDTNPSNNEVGFKDTFVEELPVIIVGTKRDITQLIGNMPGTTGQPNTFVPSVNAAPSTATEAFIDGAPSTERLQKGSLSENGPAFEQVGEVTVVTGAFNAEYGGFGNWFTNVILKSGTNAFHGSIWDHLGNNVLNARSFFAPSKPVYRQNEGGFTFGGPVVIPHVYNGHNKTFFFGSLGLFYSRNGPGGSIVTVPTQAELAGNFTGLVAANGSQLPIYDPQTQQPDGSGSFARTPFAGNIIPASRIIPAASLIASYVPPTNLPGVSNNFYDHKAATWPYYNTITPLIKVDHSISNRQKLMLSFTHQNRPRILWGNPGSGLGPQPQWGQAQTNPLDWITDQQDTSWKARINYDFVISPTLLNHLTLAADGELNTGPNGTLGQGWDNKLGITGIPADNGDFPAISFSGGTGSPVSFGRGYDANFHAMHYSEIENLTWIRGKHTLKFGGEIDRDQINNKATSNAQGSFSFSNAMTSQPDGSNFGTAGSSVASFLLGAVNSASASIPVFYGTRYLRVAMFAQDEWRATSKLTVSYGLRWDYNPPISEINGKMSSFEPNIVNPAAGGLLGGLTFTGQSGLPGKFFASSWKKGFGPRLGFAYQLDKKTVIRSAGGIYYAGSLENQSTTAYFGGYGASPSFSSPDGYTPLYYLNTGTFPQNFNHPPSLSPSFLNGQSISYLSPNASRMPQTINYTFSIQRQFGSSSSIEAVYLGNRSSHLSLSLNEDQLPVADLKYGSLLLQPITSAAAVTAGFTQPFAGFASQTGANTVYQSLRPYPQFTSVTSLFDPSGAQKFNSLVTKVNHRVLKGLTVFGFVNWQKSFSLAQGQIPNTRYWQLDANPAITYSASWSYQLPFGAGQAFLHNSAVVKAVVSGWKVNGSVKYQSGVPLTISAAAGSLGAIGYAQWGNAVAGVSPYLVTSPSSFTPSSKFLNAAAFTTSTGFNLGDMANNPSWIRGFWYKEEDLTIGRVFSIKEKTKLDFSVDAFNPFNFHRWGNPNTSLTSAAFGTVTTTAAGRTLQVNGTLRF